MVQKVFVSCRTKRTKRNPNLLRHDDVAVHKASSMNTWFAEIGVKELQRPAQSLDLNPAERLCVGWIVRGLHPRPPRPNISARPH